MTEQEKDVFTRGRTGQLRDPTGRIYRALTLTASS